MSDGGPQDPQSLRRSRAHAEPEPGYPPAPPRRRAAAAPYPVGAPAPAGRGPAADASRPARGYPPPRGEAGHPDDGPPPSHEPPPGYSQAPADARHAYAWPAPDAQQAHWADAASDTTGGAAAGDISAERPVRRAGPAEPADGRGGAGSRVARRRAGGGYPGDAGPPDSGHRRGDVPGAPAPRGRGTPGSLDRRAAAAEPGSPSGLPRRGPEGDGPGPRDRPGGLAAAPRYTPGDGYLPAPASPPALRPEPGAGRSAPRDGNRRDAGAPSGQAGFIDTVPRDQQPSGVLRGRRHRKEAEPSAGPAGRAWPAAGAGPAAAPADYGQPGPSSADWDRVAAGRRGPGRPGAAQDRGLEPDRRVRNRPAAVPDPGRPEAHRAEADRRGRERPGAPGDWGQPVGAARGRPEPAGDYDFGPDSVTAVGPAYRATGPGPASPVPAGRSSMGVVSAQAAEAFTASRVAGAAPATGRPRAEPVPARQPGGRRPAAHPLTTRLASWLRTGGRAPAPLTGGPRSGRPVIGPASGPALDRLTGRAGVGYPRSGSQRTGGQTGPAASPGAAGRAGCCCWRWPGRCWSWPAWA